MKHFGRAWLLLSALLLCALLLVSCGDKEEAPHEHLFGSWQVTVPSTHESAGSESRTCMVCHEVETRVIPQLSHSYRTEWDFSPTEHWHSCDCGSVTEKAAHDFNEDGVCRTCHASRETLVYTKFGTTVTLGSYPQTQVTDTSLTEALTALAGTLPTIENSAAWTRMTLDGDATNALWYRDIEKDGTAYRGIYFTAYRSMSVHAPGSAESSEQDDNGFSTGAVYWFRFEPVEWQILTRRNGQALLLANLVLDTLPFQYAYEKSADDSGSWIVSGREGVPAETPANRYTYSTIRAYLLNEFLGTVFSETERDVLLPASTASSLSYPTEDGDALFLPSTVEISSYLTRKEYTARSSSEYARCLGVYQLREPAVPGNASYWLRTPSPSDTASAKIIAAGGTETTSFVGNTTVGLVPALWIVMDAD